MRAVRNHYNESGAGAPHSKTLRAYPRRILNCAAASWSAALLCRFAAQPEDHQELTEIANGLYRPTRSPASRV